MRSKLFKKTVAGAAALAMAMQLGFVIPASAAETALIVEDNNLKIVSDKDQTGVLVQATYNGTVLSKVSVTDVTLKEGDNVPNLTLEDGAKLFLWSGIEGDGAMVPLCAPVTYEKAEPTPEPTPTPTPKATPKPRSYEKLYTQDYETAAADWTTSVSGRYTPIIGTASDGNKYLAVTDGERNNNGAALTSPDYSSSTGSNEDYAVEFDAILTAGNNQSSSFYVNTASGYLLGLSPTAVGATTWKVNGSNDDIVSLTADTWYHYTIIYKDGDVHLTVTDANDEKVFGPAIIINESKSTKIKNMVFNTARYNANFAIDNILIRTLDDVDSEDYMGQKGIETLSSIKFTSELNKTIAQPTLEEPTHEKITVVPSGIYGTDLSNADGIDIKWTVTGLDNEDGYISLTKDEGTELGTVGENPDGSMTAYFNVRNGVSNWFGSVTATVTYLDKTLEITTPFAVIGASGSGNNLAPAAGYPEKMSDYDDALVGYYATANAITGKDLVLNNWSMYGNSAGKYIQLKKDEDDTKYLNFHLTGNSAVGIYQLGDQSSQYITDMTVRFAGGSGTIGHYFNTPNNGTNDPNWTATYGSGSLTVGTQSVSGLTDSAAWYRIVVSADESAGTCWVKVFDSEGTLIGKIDDEPLLSTASNTQKYFCIYAGAATVDVDVASLRIYYPTAASLEITTDKETIQVPEAADATEKAQLSAILKDTDGWNMTGKVTWSLDEEYSGVTINENTGEISVDNTAGSGTIVAVASFGATRAEKEIALSTTGNSMTFTKTTASLTIPFEGEDDVVAEYAAEARNKDGQAIPGATVTYSMVDASNQPVAVPGVTFDAATGKLTVTSEAASKVVYIRAVSEVDDGAGGTETLTSRAKVNIHGLSFAFGSDEPTGETEGFTQVTAADAYTDKVGYGFADTSTVATENADVKGSADYRFKAKVPNGNYVVKVTTSASSMTSEVVESVPATTGIGKSGSQFSVAVCDGVLDLTFPSGSTLSTLTITQAEAKAKGAKPMVYAIGDSTTNNTGNGALSWGNYAANNVDSLKGEVFQGFSNNGMAGRDSVNYYNQGRVENVLLAVCPDDYVTVNMGINSKETGEGASYETLVSQYYVQAIIDRGAIPVIVTATPDGPVAGSASNNWNGDYNVATGVFTNNRGNGARNDVLRKIAKEKGLNLIELGQAGEDWLNNSTLDELKAYGDTDPTAADKLTLVQSWYVDHNHYYAPMAKWISEYMFATLKEIVETPNKYVPAAE